MMIMMILTPPNGSQDRDLGLTAYYLTTFNASIDFLMSLTLDHEVATGDTGATGHGNADDNCGDGDFSNVGFDRMRISQMSTCY